MRPIKFCLNKQLVSICHQSMLNEKMHQILLRYLPPELQNACQVGSFSKGRLTLITGAVWASQLRFMLPELRDALRSQGGFYQLTAIDIKIVH
jgi:hypothetical protein